MARRKQQLQVYPSYRTSEESDDIWVYIETFHGSMVGVTRELLGKARTLADESGSRLTGLLIGHSVDPFAEEVFSYGADRVVVIDDQRLSEFNVEAYCEAVAQAVAKFKPSIFLFGATHNGRDLAGRLAVKLQTGLNADCTDLKLDPDNRRLISEVTGFGGGVVALLECPDHRPQMSTVRPGVFPVPEPDRSRNGEILHHEIVLEDQHFQTQILEQELHEGVDLTLVDVLLCGGRGIDGDFPTLHSLAEILGGDVGATRPPVDDGHIERERQIGQTGVVCSPKVAICIGISGAFHFVVGIEKADLVIAINSDPDAPIFEYADYGIVADANTFMPILMQVFQERIEKAHA